MNDTVEQYISYKEDILVAFSGGFDSFAMFLKLLEMKKKRLIEDKMKLNKKKTILEKEKLKVQKIKLY